MKRLVLVLVLALAGSLGWGTALAVQGAGDRTPGGPRANSMTAPAHATPVTDGLFHAVTPCRLFDTRLKVGKLASLETRSYYIGNVAGFAEQGGKSGGCGIPEDAIAISGSLSAVDGTNPGYVRTWPVGQTEPTATVLNYLRGFSTGTGVTLALKQNAARSLNVKNYGGPTHLVLDVTGYITEQFQALVGPNDIESGSKHVVSVTSFGTGIYRVKFDRDLSRCATVATAYDPQTYASANIATGNEVIVYTWQLVNGNESNLNTYAYLTVTC